MQEGHVITDAETADSRTDLLYGLNDAPPLRVSLLIAFQHVLAVFVGVVTPPLIISRALNLPAADGAFLVSMALLMSGVGTLLQTRRLGPIGSGLLSIQGTSFVFVGPIIALAQSTVAAGASQRDGLAAVFGACLVTSVIPMILSPFIRRANRIITPLVTGIVVTLIGLTLVQVGITSVGGGFEAERTDSFGSAENLALALIVIAIIVSLNAGRRPWMRLLSVVAGLAGGYVVALMAGKVALVDIGRAPWMAVPMPFRYGLSIKVSALLPFAFLYVITAVESIGDITATSSLSGEPIAGAQYLRRLRGGVLADGVASLIAAVLNSFPSTTFAQNNGVIQLTGVGSRYIGTWVGLMLVTLGIFPVVGGAVEAMPQAVLGGATLIMFGTVAVAGIKILSGVDMDRRASTIAAVSLGLGLGVTFAPGILGHVPQLARDLLSSGIAAGGLCALCLNGLLPGPRV